MTGSELVHIRLDRETVQAMDMLASLWNLSRQAAAQRLLDAAIRLHHGDITALLDQFHARWLDGQTNDT